MRKDAVIGEVYGEPAESKEIFAKYKQERHAKNVWKARFIVVAILWIWSAIYAMNLEQKLRIAQSQLEIARQGVVNLAEQEER